MTSSAPGGNAHQTLSAVVYRHPCISAPVDWALLKNAGEGRVRMVRLNQIRGIRLRRRQESRILSEGFFKWRSRRDVYPQTFKRSSGNKEVWWGLLEPSHQRLSKQVPKREAGSARRQQEQSRTYVYVYSFRAFKHIRDNYHHLITHDQSLPSASVPPRNQLEGQLKVGVQRHSPNCHIPESPANRHFIIKGARAHAFHVYVHHLLSTS